MKKMMAMLLASVMAAGTFTTTAFAYTGDTVQKNTSVSTAAQEADAAENANAGKTDNTDSIEIDPDMQVLPDGYEASEEAAKYQEKKPEVTEPAETEKPQETEPAPEEQKTES